MSAEEASGRNGSRRPGQANGSRAASASGLASFQPQSSVKLPLRATELFQQSSDYGTDGKSEAKPIKKMPISPAAAAALAAANADHAAMRKLQSRASSPRALTPSSPSSCSLSSPLNSGSSFALPPTKEDSSFSSSSASAFSSLPSPINTKPQKPPKQDYVTTDPPSSSSLSSSASFLANNNTDPASPTVKPIKPPKATDSNKFVCDNSNDGNRNSNDSSNSRNSNSDTNARYSVSSDTSTSSFSSSFSKPAKPAKSGGGTPILSASSLSSSSASLTNNDNDSTKPLKPPKTNNTQDTDDSSHHSSSSSSFSPTSSGKPARPKRIPDEDPSTPRGGDARESVSKPQRLAAHNKHNKGEEEEEEYSTCTNSSNSSNRSTRSKLEHSSSFNSKEDNMSTFSRLDPADAASSESLPAEDPPEEPEEESLVSDATHTNKYGVTVVAGKALKLLGVTTPSGAMSRPGTKSPMHTSKPNNLISENGSSNVIHYTAKAISVFTDYDFKNEEHQILSYMRLGKTSAVCAALLDCSVDQFCKLIPVVACAIAETPGWATEVGETLVAAIKQRLATSPAINQAVHFLKVSRLLSYPWAYNHWVDNLQTSSYLLEVCEILATREVGYEFKVPKEKKLFHPFQAGFTITSWQVTKIFNSNAKPRLVVPSGRLESEKVTATTALVSVCGNPLIIKYGDDVRQDVAVVHIMCMMNNLWASANLTHEGCPVKSLAYGCLALSDSIGCIEFVPNALPLRLVSQAGRYSSTALNRMITSGAGSFVAAYILGVRDRHFDNILVSKHDGALFHIDFGRILGDQTTIDTGAFAITPDLKEVISSFGDDKWEVFVQLCLIAYKTIRDNNRLIISFTSMLMAPFQSQETVRNFIAQRLRLHLEDEVAMAKIRKKVSTAPTRWKTKFKNVVHGIATGD